MRRLILGFLALLLGCAAAGLSTASAQTVQVIGGGGDARIGGSPIRTEVRIGDDGTTWVGVWVDAPTVQGQSVRPPMDVALVIDTSGSMAGDKMRNARMAASSLVETLQNGDIVSLYAFSNQVMELAPPTQLRPDNRGGMMQAIARLEAGGGTAMYAGVEAGLARLSQAPSSHPVRRVVLISDGQANIGPSDPGSFGQLAARYSEFGAQVSAIGVGLDYDESTLGQLAVRSAGRLYHLEQPSQMASILEQEINLLSRTVATNAMIEVVPAPGVFLIEADTMGARLENGHLIVPLGSLYGGQQREVLFRARVPTARLGAQPLADVRFRYGSASDASPRGQTAQLRYDVMPSGRALSRPENARVAAMVASHDAAQAQLAAATMLNQGQNTAAAAALGNAADRLEVAARSTSDSRVRRRLEEQARHTRSAGARAGAARSAPAARAAALESFDDAYNAEGY